MSRIFDNAHLYASHTENGAVNHSSSGSELVDLFKLAGSSRNHPEELPEAFTNAAKVDLDVAVRILLHMRDAREGMGERNAFRVVLKSVIDNKLLTDDEVMRIVVKIPELGRYDDLFILLGTRFETEMFRIIEKHLVDESTRGLVGKWLPRVKKKNKAFTKAFCKFFKLSEKEYRGLLRVTSDTVEQKISSGNFEAIDYSKVPSLAAARLQRVFFEKDGERYADYVNSLASGKTKINAGAVYPYDVLKSSYHGVSAVAEEQWKALPNYMTGNENILCMSDVSGSMTCEVFGSVNALDIGLSLSLYVAERNKGIFKDCVLIYSTDPYLKKLEGNLSSRVDQLMQHVEYGSTDIQAAFKRILDIAKKENITQDEMPEKVIIFSDMEFNYVEGNRGQTNYEAIVEQFKDAGYEMPKIIFWYLASRSKSCEVSAKDDNVAIVSGFSPATLKAVLGGEKFDPVTVMMKAVMIPRYDW